MPEDTVEEPAAGVEAPALVDPAWRPSDEHPVAPLDKIIGVWVADAEGQEPLFRPNPVYVPTEPGAHLDLVDGVLRLLANGAGVGAPQLAAALADALLGIAVDDKGAALVRPAPDGMPSVLVATAPGHRPRVDTPGWRAVTVAKLARFLPGQGVDVLLNPGAPTSMRVSAELIRQAAGLRGGDLPRTGPFGQSRGPESNRIRSDG
ncbi:type VII secretion system-associated protein [Amycolatopsis sp. cmx-4-54]|uniref:type VII secretion system-associated protein n=1 Tax=Amycolatopsis sp. cmx-4-54 TaxID=2790936 RepID=UPI003979A43E